MLVGRHHTVGKESLGPRLLGTRLAIRAHGSRGDEGQCGVGVLLVLACELFSGWGYRDGMGWTYADAERSKIGQDFGDTHRCGDGEWRLGGAATWGLSEMCGVK